MLRTVKQWANTVHTLAIEKGWWPGGGYPGKDMPVNEILAKLALIHSEVSEALEIARDPKMPITHIWYETKGMIDESLGKPEGVGIELADVVIRVFDLAEALGIDIEACIQAKHEYNETRPARHGGKRA